MTARSHVRLMPTPTKRLAMPLLLVGCLALSVQSAEPIDIGSRRELFVDDYLVDKLTGQAELYAHKPVPEEVVLVADAPWEGNVSGYFTVFQDGDLYRMYYRGWHFDEKTRRMARPEVTCYAESKDGIEWTKPKLGVVEFNGSKENNIVHKGLGSHNFTPFLDTNPDCKPPQRYKAMGSGKGGLFAFQSPDGIRWSPLGEKPVITRGAFDSQNLAFWDATRHCYVDFHRGFRDGIRDIMTATSADFSQWSEPVWLEYPGAPKEHLYTNAIRTYERAPHILVGFPTRFHPQRGQQVEPIFMTSRDGRTFRRWTDALLPPGTYIDEESVASLLEAYYRGVFGGDPATAALRLLDEAALGRWSAIGGIEPFGDTRPTASVFVSCSNDMVADSASRLMARLAPQGPEQVLAHVFDREYRRRLDFVQTRQLMALLSQFLVSVPIYIAQAFCEPVSDNPTGIYRLRDEADYHPKSGLAGYYARNRDCAVPCCII